jgi:succinate dehydrogenase flavin-adding protein (antitoxin of CptAB toxin-antitoxin module)
MLHVPVFPTFLELLNADDKKILHIFFPSTSTQEYFTLFLFKHLYANARRRSMGN